MSNPNQLSIGQGITAAQAAGNSALGQAKTSEYRHPNIEAFEQLEDLLKQHGKVELRSSDDGTIEIRAAGMATFGSVRLRSAIERHVRVEVARVTQALGVGEASNSTLSTGQYVVSGGGGGGGSGLIGVGVGAVTVGAGGPKPKTP